MSERRSALVSTIAACAIAAGALACATPSGADSRGAPPAAGSPCTGTWTTHTDGVTIVPFAGTVSGQAPDGTRRPLAGARFAVVAGAQHGRLPMIIDGEGHFQGKVLLPTHGTHECREGVVKTGHVIGGATISVRADGCAKTEVTVDARWEPRPIDLRCDE